MRKTNRRGEGSRTARPIALSRRLETCEYATFVHVKEWPKMAGESVRDHRAETQGASITGKARAIGRSLKDAINHSHAPACTSIELQRHQLPRVLVAVGGVSGVGEVTVPVALQQSTLPKIGPINLNHI